MTEGTNDARTIARRLCLNRFGMERSFKIQSLIVKVDSAPDENIRPGRIQPAKSPYNNNQSGDQGEERNMKKMRLCSIGLAIVCALTGTRRSVISQQSIMAASY